MGIESIGSAISNYFVQKTETPAVPAAPLPAAEPAKSETVPAQYKSGFESTPLTGGAGIGADTPKVPPEVAQTFVKMNNMLADNFMKSGNYAAAKSFNDASKSFVEKLGLKDANVDPLKGVDIAPEGSPGPQFAKTQISFAESIETKAAQIKQAEMMSKAIGRPVDPQNVNDVKAYFDHASAKGTSTAAIQKEYGEYLKNNYTFTNYTWPSTPPVATRDQPDVVNKLFSGASKDMNGRTTINCKGASYLTGAIFGKNPRFEVKYATGLSHITATVFEKGKVSGFTADTRRKPEEMISPNYAPNAERWTRDRWPIEKQQAAVLKANWGGHNGNGVPHNTLADTE